MKVGSNADLMLITQLGIYDVSWSLATCITNSLMVYLELWYLLFTSL